MASEMSTDADDGSRGTASLLKDLLKKNVHIVRPGDEDWVDLVTPYNTRLPYTPAVIVVPRTEQQISDAVLCAARSGVKVQARSGGHSYGSFSTGGRDGAMVVDLRCFQDVSVDELGIAKVGAGGRLGNIAFALSTQWRALPHGTCPAVGVGGHATHGGFGMASRAWGLMMDHIVALDVVLADGSCVRASEKERGDIYFAMRGAADSFGIVTNFYFRTHPTPGRVVHIDLGFDNLLVNVADAVAVFQHIQKFAQDPYSIDRRLTLSIRFSGSLGLSVMGVYMGTLWQLGDEALPKLVGGLPVTPSSSSTEEVSWLRSLVLLSGSKELEVPQTKGPPSQDNFFTKSVTTNGPFSAETLASYFQYVKDKGPSAPTAWDAIINLHGGFDSQITAQDAGSSAYPERSALWIVQHYAYVAAGRTFPQEGFEFVEGLNEAMTRHMPRFGACANYVDPTLSRDEAQELYYGTELVRRLKDIKDVVDPGNVFSNPHSIEPSRQTVRETQEEELEE